MHTHKCLYLDHSLTLIFDSLFLPPPSLSVCTCVSLPPSRLLSPSLPLLSLTYITYNVYHTYIHTHIHEHTTVPPENTSISLLTDKTVQRDTDFELQCNSSNKHSPRYGWTHNGVNLTTLASHSPNSRYLVDIDLGLLTVKGATYDDTGVYTCTATNRAGSDSADVYIDVEGLSTMKYSPHPQ